MPQDVARIAKNYIMIRRNLQPVRKRTRAGHGLLPDPCTSFGEGLI
jgi:hypothetical protein